MSLASLRFLSTRIRVKPVRGFKRSDIGPILMMFVFNFFTSGTYGIFSFGTHQQLDFFDNLFAPIFSWFSYTFITYIAIVFWRRKDLEEVIFSSKPSKRAERKNNKEGIKAPRIWGIRKKQHPASDN